MTKLLRISAPHFTAGAVFEKDHKGWHLREHAPILNWLKQYRRHWEQVRAYCDRRGWTIEWLADPHIGGETPEAYANRIFQNNRAEFTEP